MNLSRMLQFIWISLFCVTALSATAEYSDSASKTQKATSTVKLTRAEKLWLLEHPDIHLSGGVIPPLDGIKQNGTVAGIGPDYTRLIAKKLGIRFEYSTDILARVHEKAKRNEIDGIRLAIPSKKRESYLNFSKPYTQLSQGLLTLDSVAPMTELAQLSGRKLGVLKGSFLFAYVEEHYPEIELVPVETFEVGIERVINGQADALYGALAPIHYVVRTHTISGVQISALIQDVTRNLTIGVRKDWPELIPILNKAINAITPEEHEQIAHRWISGISTPSIALTVEERAWLRANPVIPLGNSVDWQPIGFVDKNGLYSGIAADHISYIGKMLGVQFKPSKLDSWKETVERSLTGKLYMLGSAVPTSQRKKHLTFTEPYLSYPLVIITRMDVPFIGDMSALQGERVAVNAGSATHDILQMEHPEIEIYPVKNTKHGLMSVAAGEAAVFIGDLVTSSHVMAEEGITELKVSGETPYTYDISMAIHKSQPLLASILQKALDTMPEAKRNEIYRKWLSVTFEHRVDYTFLIEIILFIVLVFISLLLWIRHLQVKRLTAEIVSRKAAEESLNEAQQIAHLGSWEWDIQNNVPKWSDEQYRMLGLEPGQIEPSYDYYLNAIHEEDRGAVQAAVEKALSGAAEYNIEFRISREDGQELIVHAQGRVERDSRGNPLNMVGTTYDITSLKQTEMELRQSEAGFRLVIDKSPIPMVIVDAQGNIEHFNQKFIDSFGWTTDDVYTPEQWWSSAYPDPDYRRQVEDDWERAAAEASASGGEIKPQEWLLTCKSGEQRDVEFRMVPVSSERSVITMIDITERKRAAESLQEANEELDSRVRERTQELSEINESLLLAKEVAESANRAKSVFLSKMSHELRTPMNAILGYAQILYNDNQLTEKQHKRLKIILESGDHLLALISDILDLARIESSRLELEIAPVAIRPFINELAEVVRYRAGRKELSFECDVAQLVPTAVMVDGRYLRQILLNLLSNAVKFTHEGSVTLRLSLCHAENDSSKNCCLRFVVEDTGVGIPEESRQEIFNSFTQLLTDGYVEEGTGLGLTISHQLVQMMGGELQLTSEVGSGSRFWFDIELPVREWGAESSEEAILFPGGYQGRKYKIMVVDDIEYNRDMLRDLLEDSGFVVIGASDGAESIELAQTELPDLILMDLVMPLMDGYQAVAALRLLPKLSKVPVVAISASVTEREKALDSGFDRFIPKPVVFGELKEMLDELLNLDWIGSDRYITENREMESSADEEANIPPAGQLLELKKLVEMGKMRRIIEWADTLEAGSPGYAAFARRIRVLAEKIDGEGLLAMVT